MTSDSRSSVLPSFDRPPVVEAILGVEFAPLQGLGAINLGRFHRILEDVYPKTVELFASGPEGPAFLLPGSEQAQSPAIRLWMLTEDGAFLVQCQYDRVILNWRKVSPDSVYPRFGAMQSRFLDAWGKFNSLTLDRELGSVIPMVVEVSYVNSVDLTDDVTISSIFGFMADPARSPDTLNFNLAYPLAAEHGLGGRVTVTAAKALDDKARSVVQFNVSARVGVGDSTSLPFAIDSAHRAAVIAFSEATSEDLQSKWGRQE